MIRERFSEHIRNYLSDDSWMILEDHYDPEENLKYESLFCLSNGYLGTRGAYEERAAKSIPCTYINGVFDKSETFMRELANLPDWLGIKLYVEKELIGIETCRVLEFSRALDMKHALLAKRFVLEDKKGRRTEVEGIRMVSRANVHRMGIRLFVTPLNYSGIIEVENIIDGSVINFCDAPRFKVKHTRLLTNCPLTDKGAYVEVTTRDRKLCVGTGSLMEAYAGGRTVMKNRSFGAFGETAVEFQDFDAEEGKAVEVVKYASVYTEREVPDYELHCRVRDEIKGFAADGFEMEMSRHIEVYARMWDEANIEIRGDFDLDRAVRFTLFHLMSTGSEHDDRVNVGAKLLSGEEYGGHAFWDTELFMLPFFACVFPDTARNLENYRYRLLDAARANAAKNGYCGAQYPWESADDGTEQCPDWTIEPDGTCYRCYVAVYEHHVTAAVAYGIYNYVKITGDRCFLREKGAEILIETARFWASRCEYNRTMDRYEIRRVTGPDEWHEPVDNNLYTNYLARWNLGYVLELLTEWKEDGTGLYEELKARLNILDEELESWSRVREKMYLPKGKENGLLEQFEGYFDLKDVTIEAYDENDWPIRPEILRTVPKTQTQIIKQADVVMLLHLLGEEFDEETKRKNYTYYEKRTLHGSSLSPSIYSVMGLHVGDETKAYRYLRRAAFIDLTDLQKNTREGIHAANAGGVWQTVVFGFAGVSFSEDGVVDIRPHMPKEWEGLSFKLHHRGSKMEITVLPDNSVTVTVLEGGPVSVRINGEAMVLEGSGPADEAVVPEGSGPAAGGQS